MKKYYLDTFINSIEKDKYTLDQLYDEYKYFCDQNVIPRASKPMFRQAIEFCDCENIKIRYDDNLIKIRSITIS